MIFEVVALEENEKWDGIVKTFSKYDIYWLSGYVKAFELHGDGIPLLFYYKSDSVRGINVVMKRDISDCLNFHNVIPRNQFFDLSSPYGYGGWLIEGDDPDKLFKKYELWCRNNNIICEFVRFHPVIENHLYCESQYEVVPLGNTIAMDLSTRENIWTNLISKNRNMIRKAKKNGVKVYNGRNPMLFGEFQKIYNMTMDKDNAESYYYFKNEFYSSILNDLPYNTQIFYAEYEGKIIAAAIMLAANGKMNYHLSGSLKEFSSLAATNLILYEAANWGTENGYRTLYLGGGVGSGEDSLYKFKKAFYRKDDDKRFYIGKKIFNQNKYAELVQTRGNVDSNFFPKYRA